MYEDGLKKFQDLLRTLFQFDCADLDFGIYRIMNYKRGVFEQFITQDLPRAVADELNRAALASQSQALRELQEIAKEIREKISPEAIDADGNLVEKFHETELGKKYLELKAKAAGSQDRQAFETLIFNHLYTFFSRYYQDGDFISKRRYSKREKYAIPYNGEEVYLYWSNQDQYYIKTSEHFRDYSFTVHGITVHFKLRAAEVEQDNVKGDKRFFLPQLPEIVWEEDASRLVIPFEYRPLTEQEESVFGSKNQQEGIISKALEEIREHFRDNPLALTALMSERRRTGDDQSVSFLEHHLRKYTRRNTSDFFIHKDLRGFLSRELDFYLKNEVLNLDVLETAGENLAEGWFQVMRVIKTVGSRIIEFLAQIEDFQKMLWQKKKFITETQYCITMGNIDEAFYPEVAACESQWEEWKDLFHIDEEQTDLFTQEMDKEEKRIAFLKSHPTLVLDTKHFDSDFVDRLLASFDDLDAITDGLLIHSENWQALNLLSEKYRAKAQCIYIDPPFNTGGDFLYIDMFRNSTWLALLEDRIDSSLLLLSQDGNYFIHLDYNSMHYGKMLLLKYFSDINELVFNTNATKDEESGLFSYKSFAAKFVRQHDTILHAFNVNNKFVKLWKPNRNTSKLGLGQLDILSTPKKQNPQSLADFRFYIECYNDDILIQKEMNINEKIYPIGDIWNDIYSFTQSEMRTSENVSFPTQKPENLLRRIIQATTTPKDLIVDFFAGSGTTAAVAHKLRRRYIAVEMGEYFEVIYYDYDSETRQWVKKLGILGRMKNVLHGDERFDACGKGRRSTLSKQIGWKGGGVFKYIRLESYEDALNNIEFDDAAGQPPLPFEDYLIKYMLKWETRKSETLLNVEKLARPFSYKLRIYAEGQTGEKVVDIPETFNYLLGLHIKTRQVFHDDDRRYLVYRGFIDHRQVTIIWRETHGWTEEDFERDRRFVAEQKLGEGADEIFVNGDSLIPGARALEPVFKARMFSPVKV